MEGSIGVYKTPQNRRKKHLKPQNHTKTCPKPKTTYITVKTNKIVISGAFKEKYTDAYFIKVFVRLWTCLKRSYFLASADFALPFSLSI